MITKSIHPAFTKIGKRAQLTGYIGQLVDGETVISSKEYDSYHAAEVALDALAFDLLIDQQEAAGEPIAEGHVDDPIWGCDICGKSDECECFDDDYGDAMAESAQGTYNGYVPSTCVFCHKPHAAQTCPDMRALLFAPLDVDFAPIGPEVA